MDSFCGQLSQTGQSPAIRNDPASASAAAALENDPFYRAICAPYADDPVRRRALLLPYFDYSIQEGRELGRCVHLADPACGVAVWLLPQTPAAQKRAADKKREFLRTTLAAEGCANYYRILDFMKAKSATIVNDDAWYLSIVAVTPTTQGRGLGRKLLEPTLAEADRVSATCYLETFTPRNVAFYERLGFMIRTRFLEPTINAEYALLVR
jgi:ribosomal protein S18 acetylase RimI-like enzyme